MKKRTTQAAGGAALTLPEGTQPGTGVLITYDEVLSRKTFPEKSGGILFGAFHAIVTGIDGAYLSFKLVRPGETPEDGVIDLEKGCEVVGPDRQPCAVISAIAPAKEKLETLEQWAEFKAPARTVPPRKGAAKKVAKKGKSGKALAGKSGAHARSGDQDVNYV